MSTRLTTSSHEGQVSRTHPLDEEGLSLDDIYEISRTIQLLPGPKMRLFRNDGGSIHAGLSMEWNDAQDPSGYDATLNLEGVLSQDMSGWVALDIESLAFKDLVHTARALQQENERVAKHTNRCIAELSTIAPSDQYLSRAMQLKVSILRSAAYRLTTISPVVPLLGWTHKLWSRMDQMGKPSIEEMQQPVCASFQAEAASWGCVSVNYDRTFAAQDIKVFACANANVQDVLVNTAISRLNQAELTLKNAL
jgi:hypothetical protein